jgi:uncharacterized OB-fold protein
MVPTSGNGIVYSFAVVEVAIVKAIAYSIPYVPAVIAFPEAGGVRLIANIVGSRVGDIAIDTPVHVVWHERADGWVLPYFTLGAAS